jgi:hypothetical protein
MTILPTTQKTTRTGLQSMVRFTPSPTTSLIVTLTLFSAEVVDPMNDAFQDGEVTPAGGFANLPGGPTIFCDTGLWEWVDMDEDDPYSTTGGTLRENRAAKWAAGTEGAWYYKGRFISEVEKSDSFPICAGTTLAAASPDVDMIQICFDVNPPANFAVPDSVTEDADLDDLREYLSSTLLHELVHWYSADQRTATMESKFCLFQTTR